MCLFPRMFSFVVLSILPFLQGLSIIVSKDPCNNTVAECFATSKKHKPVCGTDGISYSSHCDVIEKQCKGELVFVNYVGLCVEDYPCFSARENVTGALQPTCNADGTFAQIQCHHPSRYCWCVTPAGVRLPDTLTQDQTPLCPLRQLDPFSAESQTSPMSMLTRNERLILDLTPKWNHRDHCTKKSHLRFSQNLMKIFEIEYNRAVQLNTTATVDDVLVWKFNQLDTNADGYLDKMEYTNLMKLAAKGVRPKKCARSFPTICDIVKDSRISLVEWTTCLKNITIDLLHVEGLQVLISDEQPVDSEDAPRIDLDNSEDDCPSKRAAALKYQQKTSQLSLYIPECTQKGLYQPVQCYSGLCWCVHQQTGVSIPNTTSTETKPDCRRGLPPVKIITRCYGERQDKLPEAMMNVMRSKFEIVKSYLVNRDFGESEEERAATWMFLSLDLNKNKVLQRGQEWKNIRKLLPGNKCAKRFPKLCDVNQDERISLNEWLECLNVEKGQVSTQQLAA
ncbi:SPARC-related modular calcium-binding protein 1-like [Diachasmimorpha longicaudata]|uniref:SPARC-related modular calcium-binding protein 1-like n=1 Tax=Diachasmimorpha longicaudata TaxID=58733 RepID=UPI0030B8DF63